MEDITKQNNIDLDKFYISIHWYLKKYYLCNPLKKKKNS